MARSAGNASIMSSSLAKLTYVKSSRAMPAITTMSGRIYPWVRMHRFFVLFSGSVTSPLGRSSADFIMNTAGRSIQQGHQLCEISGKLSETACSPAARRRRWLPRLQSLWRRRTRWRPGSHPVGSGRSLARRRTRGDEHRSPLSAMRWSPIFRACGTLHRRY